MNDLDGRRALVTGGSRGIGAAIVAALASRGADVAFSHRRTDERTDDVVRGVEALGRRTFAIRADQSDPAAISRLVAEAVDLLGGLDILVNNAGTARAGALATMTLKDIDVMLDVNIRGTILTTQAAIPHLESGGRIITIGSNLAERVPFPGLTVYALTKSAQLSFTRGLARELGPTGITVNLVQPGPTDTDMNPADGALAAVNRDQTALGRYGVPAEIAAVVAFLAGPAAAMMTGSVVTVDGGFNA